MTFLLRRRRLLLLLRHLLQVSVTWYLVDIDHMPRVAKVREELFEGCKPASGTVPINKLLVPELMLEVSAIAVLSRTRDSAS